MKNTRDNIIKKIALTHKLVNDEFLSRINHKFNFNFRDIDHLILCLKLWIKIERFQENEKITFCNTENCQNMVMSLPTGYKKYSQNEHSGCIIYDDPCKNIISEMKEKFVSPLIEYPETKYPEIEQSINILTRDVLSVVLKHYIKIERREVERYIMQFLSPFKSFKQVMFALENVILCDELIMIKFNICTICGFYTITQLVNFSGIYYTETSANNQTQKSNNESLEFTVCDDCKN